MRKYLKEYLNGACRTRWHVGVLATAVVAVVGMAWQTAALAGVASEMEAWNFHGYYQNNTQYRMGHDQTGDVPGLSREDNTLQLTFNKGFWSGWHFIGTLRGQYNGVYDLNRDEYGRFAGGPIELQNTAAPAFAGSPLASTLGQPFVPFGGGINHADAIALGLPPTNALGFNSTNPNAPNYNPNQGLQVLGQRWHPLNNGGVEFGVPVRPCNVDSRGCANFGGYGDLNTGELRFPDFNSRMDFLRELYVTKNLTLPNGHNLFVKVGRQQVVWGRTDLFRVLDVVNPVDFSRNNIYDDLQDMRYPSAMINTTYNVGGSKWLQDSNFQVLWIVEKFRPDNLGQCGEANVMLNAGCTFRGLKNLWDNGGTVANFASVPPGTPGMYAATDFGPHQIGIRNVDLPGWKMSNTQVGLKYGGESSDGSIAFSLNYLYTRSQLPSLHGINGAAINPFTGSHGNTVGPGAGIPVEHLIAFDMEYPRVRLFGGSLDYQWDWAKAAVRFEGAYSSGEEFANTLQPDLYSANHVLRTVVGIDRPTFIPYISGPSTTLISAQVFMQHIFGFQREQMPLGTAGMVGWENDVTATLLLQGTYLNGRLHPTIIFARDFMARADVIVPSVTYSFTDNLVVTLGVNLKDGGDLSRYTTSDCRSCNPYPPFTTYTGANPPQGFSAGDYGLGGIEPLGFFKAGPFATARRENQAFLTLRQSF